MRFKVGTHVSYDNSNGMKLFEVYGVVIDSDDERTIIEHVTGSRVVAENCYVQECNIDEQKMNGARNISETLISTNETQAGWKIIASQISHKVKNLLFMNARELHELNEYLKARLGGK